MQAVRCTDPNVLCSLRQAAGGGQELLLAAYASQAPFCAEFLVLFGADPFFAQLAFAWHFTVHGLRRVDVHAVRGQSSRVPLTLE